MYYAKAAAGLDDPARAGGRSNMDMGKISISIHPSTHPRFGPNFYKQTLEESMRMRGGTCVHTLHRWFIVTTTYSRMRPGTQAFTELPDVASMRLSGSSWVWGQIWESPTGRERRQCRSWGTSRPMSPKRYSTLGVGAIFNTVVKIRVPT